MYGNDIFDHADGYRRAEIDTAPTASADSVSIVTIHFLDYV
jgi:hypothetical protein